MERGDHFFDESVPSDSCSSAVRLFFLLLATLLTWLVWRRYLADKDTDGERCRSTLAAAMDFECDTPFSSALPPPCCQVESCGGAAYCNPSYNDDDDESVDEEEDDDEDDSSSGDERNLASASLYQLELEESVMLPRLGFLEPIAEETSDDLRSEESRSEASGRWGWDCSSTDGAPSVIHVTPTPAVTLTTEITTTTTTAVSEGSGGGGGGDDVVSSDGGYDFNNLDNNTLNTGLLLPPAHLGSNKDQELDKWLESSMLELEGEEAVVLVPGVRGDGGGGRNGSDRFDLDQSGVCGGGGATKQPARAPAAQPLESSQGFLQTPDNRNSHSQLGGGERPGSEVTMTTDDAAGSTGVLRNVHGSHASQEVTSHSLNGYPETDRVLKANSFNLQQQQQHKTNHVVTNYGDEEPQELMNDLQLDQAELLILFENGDNGGGESGDDDAYFPPHQNMGVLSTKEEEEGVDLQSNVTPKGVGGGGGGVFADWNQAIDDYLCSLVASPWRTPPTSHISGSCNQNNGLSGEWQHNENGDVFPVIGSDVTDLICSDNEATTRQPERSAAITAKSGRSEGHKTRPAFENKELANSLLEETRHPQQRRHEWADHAHTHAVNFRTAAQSHREASISNSNPNLHSDSNLLAYQPPFLSTTTSSSAFQGSKGIVDNLDLAITRPRGVEGTSENFNNNDFSSVVNHYKFAACDDPVYYDECIAARDRAFDDFEEENDYDWASSSSDEEGRGKVRGGGLQHFHGVFEDLTQIAALGDELSSPNSDADSDDPGRYYECFNDHVVCGDSSLVRSLSLTDLRSYSSGDGLHDDGERCTRDGSSEGRTRANSGSSEPDTPSTHTTTRPSTENLSEDSGYCDTGGGATVLERADSSSPDEDVIIAQQLQQQQQQQQRGKYPIGVIPEDEESEDCSATTVVIANDSATMNHHDLEKVNSARVRLEQLLLRDHDRRNDIYSDAELSDGRERAVNLEALSNGESSFKRDFDLLYNAGGEGEEAGCYGNGMVAAALDELAMESVKASNSRKQKQRSKKRGISEGGRFHEFETMDKMCSSGVGEGGWQEALLQREWERSVKSGRAATDDWLVLRACVPKTRICLKPTRSADCLMWPVARDKEVWEDGEGGTDIDGGALSCPPSFATTTKTLELKTEMKHDDDSVPLNVGERMEGGVMQPEAELVIVEEGEVKGERGGGMATEDLECGNGLRAKMMPDGGGGEERRSWHDYDLASQGGPVSGAGERGQLLGDGPSLALGQTHHESGVGPARSLPELQSASTATTTDVGRELSRAFGRLSVKARAADEDPATFVSWKQDNTHRICHDRRNVSCSRTVPAATHVGPRPSGRQHPTQQQSPDDTCTVSETMNQAKWLATSPTKEEKKKKDTLAEVRRVQVSLASRPRPTRPPPPPPHSSCASPQPRSDADDVTISAAAASRVHVTEREAPSPSNVQHVAVNSPTGVSETTNGLTNDKCNNENGHKLDVDVDDDDDVDGNGTDRAARALEDSFRQLERAISSLEQDIGHVSPQRHSPWPPPDSQQYDPFYLHDDEPTSPGSPSKPLTPSRARIVDARRQFFVPSPSSSAPTSPEPPSPTSQLLQSPHRPDDLAAVFDSFRQRAQEGRERVARSVVDLSEIERAVRVQIDSLATSTQAPPSPNGRPSEGLPAPQQSRARAPASPPRAHVTRPRSQSAAGYLETDVDTLQSREVLHVSENEDPRRTTTAAWERSALYDDDENYDDDVEGGRHYYQQQQHIFPVTNTQATSSPTKAASMLSLPGDHRPRYGQPASPARTQDEADRARSMEFLLDADNKAAAQPPENALMRGAETTRTLSQHELRVRRSLQRLDVPDWFKNSPHSKSGSFLLLKRSPEPNTGSGWPSSTVSSRTPSASSLQQQTSPSTTTPTRPRAPTAPSSTTATSISTRIPPPYCWRYPRHSRESLQSPGSPSPSPQPGDRGSGGSYQFSRWGSARISSSSVGGTLSTPSPSPTGTLSRPPGLLVHRQPYLGWRSSERLSREVSSAHTTPTHFYRSAAERLSAGPGYYALRYGAYGKPGSEGNLLAPRSTPPGPPPLKRSPIISPSASKPPIPPKPVVSPTSGQYRPAATQLPVVTNGYAPSSEHEDTPPQLQEPIITCPPASESQLQSPPKSPRQRVIWMESSFVGVKPGKGSPTPTPAPPATSSTGSSPNRKTPSPAHDTSPSGGYRSKSSLVSGGSDDIRLNKAKRSFGQIHDEEGSSRDSSSPVATLEEVLDSLLAIPSGGSRSASPSTRGAGRFYVADGDSSSDADSRRSSTALLDGESMVKVDGAPAGVSPPLPPPRSHSSSSSSSCNSEPSSRSGSFSAGRLAQGLSDHESPHRLHQHLQHCSPLPETPSAPPLEDCTSPQPSSSPHANDDECETDLGRLAGDEDLADNDVILLDRRGSHPRPPTPPPRSLAPDAASSSPVGAPPTLHHVHWGTLPVTNTPAPAPEGEPGEAGGECGTEEASSRRRGSEQLRNLLPDDLLVRCSFPRCAKTVAWAEARRSFKTCHNCYTYYCSRECRRLHWDKHRRTCMYSRVRSLCRHVILHSHDDVSVRAHLSKLARTGVLTQGRGFIKIGFRNPELAERFLQNGWSALEDNPIYMAWRDLLPQEFGADIYHEMSEMCKSYNPEVKFILLVAVYVTREIPAQPVPRWEREIIAKCAKMPLRKPGGPSGDEYGDPSLEPDTLILTAVPAPSSDMQASPRQARHHCFTNIQRHLGQRGVSLRHQFPDVFDKLNNYVERDELFPPITIYPKDGRTGKTFMCLIMASTEPEIEAVVRDFARKT